jgi:hypothetical protein
MLGGGIFMQNSNRKFLIVSIFFLDIILAFFLSSAQAFYEWQGNEADIEFRGMLQIYGTAYRHPENTVFYKDRDRFGLGALARLILKASIGDALTLESNIYQTYIPEALLTDQTAANVIIQDVERSSALEWSLSDSNYVHTTIDRFNVRWSKDRLDLIMGRQAINLATTFYFSPNDFFAPFAAQAFYRVYKPGVDALRAEVRLGDLSQLSLISVLGYKTDPDTETGWSDSPVGHRTSYIGRISTVFKDFEWALLVGALGDSDVAGGSLQGELFQWLGIRAEGHIRYPEDPLHGSYKEFTVGLEHYWENNLDIRLEYFHHGSGLGEDYDYSDIPALLRGWNNYLGRDYTALGLGYEFTPLLSGHMSLIHNLRDNSGLCAFNAVYSLSNEAELALNLGLPFGKRPKGARIRSEFGLYPYSINLEVRYYF